MIGRRRLLVIGQRTALARPSKDGTAATPGPTGASRYYAVLAGQQTQAGFFFANWLFL